jgi:hypothetical protein
MDDQASGWAVGWTAFAGIMMVIGGIWWVIIGIIALVNDNFYVVTEEYIFQFNVTTWGWIHLLLGILVTLAGIYLFTGAVWARIIGVAVAIVWMIAAFAWLPYAPVWAIALLAIAVFIIWALTVHGSDIAET